MALWKKNNSPVSDAEPPAGKGKKPNGRKFGKGTPHLQVKASGQLHTMASDLRYGRSISANFFRQNAWLLVAFLAAVLSLMGLRYQTKLKMAEIKDLTVQLQRAESSKLQEKAAYMSLIRETEMKRLVDEQGLGLQFREEPPCRVKYEKQ